MIVSNELQKRFLAQTEVASRKDERLFRNALQVLGEQACASSFMSLLCSLAPSLDLLSVQIKESTEWLSFSNHLIVCLIGH